MNLKQLKLKDFFVKNIRNEGKQIKVFKKRSNEMSIPAIFMGQYSLAAILMVQIRFTKWKQEAKK